jgi:hypothetical protein
MQEAWVFTGWRLRFASKDTLAMQKAVPPKDGNVYIR